MRRILAITLLFALAMPALAQENSDIVVEFEDNADKDDAVAVDAGTDAGKTISIRAPVASFQQDDSYTPVTVQAGLSCTCGQPIVLAMEGSANVWSAALPVDTPDLVAGRWDVRVTGVDAAGTARVLGPHHIDVTVPDTDGPPNLAVSGVANGLVKVGANAVVDIEVEESYLRDLTYQKAGMPFPLPIAAPHVLPVERFEAGLQTVSLVARDRAGGTTTLQVQVFADAVAPDVVADLPSVLYEGVPNPIVVHVSEHSPFTVQATLGQAQAKVEAVGNGSQQRFVLQVTPLDAAGVLELTVVDGLLNTVLLRQDVDVRVLETDLHLHGVALDNATAIPGEARTLTLNVSQSVSPVPLTVDVVHGDRVLGQINVTSEATPATLEVRLPSGPNREMLVLRVPPGVVELNVTDQSKVVGMEFFAGRVIHGADLYHIRTSAEGFPREAVGANGTYALAISDRGLGSVYAFSVEGADLWWDPATPSTTVPTGADPVTNKDSPGLPVILVLAALALAFRRR